MAVTVRGKGKFLARKHCHFRVRKKVVGTPSRPRLVVSRLNRHMLAQIIDDSVDHTLAMASTYEAELRGDDGTEADKVHKVGEPVAKRALEAGISPVVSGRGGNKCHSRVAAVTEGAHAAGLTLWDWRKRCTDGCTAV